MSKPVPPATSKTSPSAANARQGPIMATYARRNLQFTRGDGPWLFTSTGEQYLDCGSGIAVTALGHTHPRLVKTLQEQAATLWHTSNIYPISQQEELAKALVGSSFADTAFFCNSGAEACEAAIKTARRYHFTNGAPERWRIITFEGAFHGRTLATIAAGGNPKYLEGFGPEVDGFDHVPFANHDAVAAAIALETAAIMIEPVQGEGGIRVVPPQCLAGLRELCDEHGLLLIFDEVQTGMGRTGKLFAHQWSSVTPDIMAIAKGLGGGFPIGAVLATAEAAAGMTAGSHGSTFGGNPMACAVANEVLSIMQEPDFMTSVQSKGLQLKQSLESLKDRHSGLIEDVRGVGLLAGLKLKVPVPDLVNAAEEQKLLLVGAGDNVVRILPPLTITEEQLADAMSRLDHALSTLKT